MGIVITANCSKCNYNEDFYIGVGMLFMDIEFIKRMFNSDVAKRIDSLQNSDKSQNFKAEYALAYCEQCGKLNSMPRAEFYLANGTIEELRNPCTCGAPLKIINIDDTNIACPLCKNSVKLNETGLWD